MSLKGTKTEKNLLTAFAGESQARNRYNFAASVAKKEGYVQISKIFEETAAHEKEHAKRLFKFMEGGEVEITASYPAGHMTDTVENLKMAAGGENHEYTEMYPSMAKIAEEEGFPKIAAAMRSIAIAEEYHEERFLAVLASIETGTVFKKAKTVTWRCQNCGFNHEGANAPEKCPACDHPQAHFEVKATNW